MTIYITCVNPATSRHMAVTSGQDGTQYRGFGENEHSALMALLANHGWLLKLKKLRTETVKILFVDSSEAVAA